MKLDETEVSKMLESKWKLQSFEDVRQWDSNARIILIEIEEFIASKESQMNGWLKTKMENIDKLKSTPFLLRSFQIGKILGVTKSQKALASGEKELHRALNLKKQIDLNKKEVQLQIKQIKTNTKQKINRIENRVLFTNPNLKRLQKIKAEKKQDKAVTPLDESLMDLEAQELEVDKMILWYEKIKYS